MIFDASSELALENKAYQQALELFVWQNFQLDMPKKDLTTRTFVGRASQNVKAIVVAKEEGILAGMQEVEWFLNLLDLEILESKEDGVRLEKGELVMEIQGRASMILAAERTLLNTLQRMSGIATKTKRLSIKLMPEITLLATRKTLWGPLDKRAVAVGGGGTHRLNLEDAILVKENHITLAKNFKRSLKAAFKQLSKTRFVEVELESEAQVMEFLDIHHALQKFTKDHENLVVMLDNFKPAQIATVITPLKKAGLQVELSGGINEKNIIHYNIVGVDAISSSSLTMSAPGLDLSLLLDNGS